MAQRSFPRIKRRVNCDLTVGGKRYVGVALELSPKGFFVQTTAKPDIGERVRIELRTAGDTRASLDAEVANRREAPRRLASVTHSGLGFRLTAPPEDYYQFLATLS